jgi:bifunctional DNA-binding transcriptional regulator/antitoxin component of YhaV-PrlF toxin-antitoxin module
MMTTRKSKTSASKVEPSPLQGGGFAEPWQAPFDLKPSPAAGSNQQVVELGAGGRLVIPAPFRVALGMKPGDKLTVRLEANELRIYSRREGIRRAREMIRKYIPDGVNLADELIAERRAEAAGELEEGAKGVKDG